MSIASFQTGLLKQRERETQQTVNIGGVDYPCVRSLTRKGNVPTEGGSWLTAGGTMTIRRDVLPGVPYEGVPITIDGATYKILSVADDAAIPFIRIEYGKTPKP